MASTGYELAHLRVKSRYASARNYFCTFCGLEADQWAIDHDAPGLQHDEKGRAYSLDPDAYVPLCVRCHRAYDKHVSKHGTAGVVELIDQLQREVPEDLRDSVRAGVISSIGSLMRRGYLRPGRDRPFRAGKR
ncbi:hypothetical protein [Streptomyces sp. CdTB01]|uniref:hypothetical protein n=1 Tax=Streptomyces sp. CdTB01 TaxID=1725411 RepID=UPI000AA160F5|nr:hypothetical protein [Streptomyces sp. CdTB01]